MLSTKQNNIIGLDINDSSVKIVQLTRTADNSDKYSVTAAGYARIENPQNPGQKPTDEQITKAIRQCLKSADIKTGLSISALSGEQIIVRNFTLPHLNPDEISGAVELEAAQTCQFEIGKCTVDYQLTNNDANTAGFYVIASNEHINTHLNLTGKSNMPCVLLDIEGLALLNLFLELHKTQSAQTVAIMNINSDHSTIAIMGQDKLPFIRNINCPLGNTERLNADTCKQLFAEAANTLRFYTARHKSEPLDVLYLCGDFQNINQLVELLGLHLQIKVTLWNPFDNISCSKTAPFYDLVNKNGHPLAAAAGLALRLNSDARLKIDLLKGKGLPEKTQPHRIAAAAALLTIPLLTLIIMAGMYIVNGIEIKTNKKFIESYNKKISELSDVIEFKNSLDKEKQSINAALSEVASAVKRHTQWSPILSELTDNIPDSMTLTKLTAAQELVKQKPSDKNTDKTKNITIPKRTLQISLCGSPGSNSDLAVKQFGDRIRLSKIIGPKIEDIRISQKTDSIEKKEIILYQIDCILKTEI